MLHAASTAADSEDDAPARDADEDDEEVRAIDATLARFSAVHDEIAAEEEKRRGKLFAKRKEPELGTDMPFDFHASEGRGGKSRMEWKQKQRKRRTNLVVLAVAVVVSLSVFLSIGLMWG